MIPKASCEAKNIRTTELFIPVMSFFGIQILKLSTLDIEFQMLHCFIGPVANSCLVLSLSFLVQLLRSTDLGRHSLLYIKEIGHGWFGKVNVVGLLLIIYLFCMFVHLTDMNALGIFCYGSKI